MKTAAVGFRCPAVTGSRPHQRCVENRAAASATAIGLPKTCHGVEDALQGLAHREFRSFSDAGRRADVCSTTWSVSAGFGRRRPRFMRNTERKGAVSRPGSAAASECAACRRFGWTAALECGDLSPLWLDGRLGVRRLVAAFVGRPQGAGRRISGELPHSGLAADTPEKRRQAAALHGHHVAWCRTVTWRDARDKSATRQSGAFRSSAKPLRGMLSSRAAAAWL